MEDDLTVFSLQLCALRLVHDAQSKINPLNF